MKKIFVLLLMLISVALFAQTYIIDKGDYKFGINFIEISTVSNLGSVVIINGTIMKPILGINVIARDKETMSFGADFKTTDDIFIRPAFLFGWLDSFTPKTSKVEWIWSGYKIKMGIDFCYKLEP